MKEDYLTVGPPRADEHSGAPLPVPPAPELDVAEYLPELADFDLSEGEKIELLQTLWSLMQSFVELGFTTNICERIFENAPLVLHRGAGVVDSSPQAKSMERKPDGAEKEDS